MKIAIVGSREFNDYDYLCKCMDYLNSSNMEEIMYRGACELLSKGKIQGFKK